MIFPSEDVFILLDPCGFTTWGSCSWSDSGTDHILRILVGITTFKRLKN
jgi:hypothetical protein